MTKIELLDALHSMSVGEQLEILEITSKLIRSRLSDSTPLSDSRTEQRIDLEIAAEKMRSYYAEGGDLTGFIDRNSKDFYEYSEYA